MQKRFKNLFVALFFMVLSSFMVASATNDDTSKVLNKIPIAMATDNNYVYPTVIAMTSMLENKNPSTMLEFHVMISGEVTDYNRDKIKNLENIYDNCSVNLFDMKNKFKTSYINPSHITTPTYYRLSLPSMLSEYDKILYLDGDIIVTKDLWEMFSTDIADCYIGAVKGFGQICFQLNPNTKDYAKRLGVKDMNQCINAGILIMNLKQMREDKLEDKFNEFIPQLKQRRLTLNDQDILNATCYDRIKFLSPKYNAFQHVTFNYDNLPILVDCYDMEEFKEACLNPTIIHYTSAHKPWKSNKCRFYSAWDKYRKIAEKKLYGNQLIKNGIYTISSALDDKKVLDISAASKNNGANVQLWESHKSDAQKFKICS